jgi:hypothetical protein
MYLHGSVQIIIPLRELGGVGRNKGDEKERDENEKQ